MASKAPKNKGKMQISDSYRKVKWPLNILQWQRVNVKLNRKEKKALCCTFSSLQLHPSHTILLSPNPSITPQRAFCAYPLHMKTQK